MTKTINWMCIVAFSVLCSLFLGCRSDHGLPPYASDEPIRAATQFHDFSTSNGISFSPEGNDLYVSLATQDTFSNGRQATGIFQYSFDDGLWSHPQRVNLGEFLDAYHPALSIDGNKLFFNSRYHPDSSDTYLPHDLWYSQKQETGWSAPKAIDIANTTYYESYPSVAANGNLYFNSNRPGGKGGMDIYVSKFRNENFESPVWLESISSADEENDLVVDPQERFIIFNRYIHADQSIDLWISLNKDGQWTAPMKLDQINQPDIWELTPTISPDGKYFFYEVNGKIWQIELDQLIDPKDLD